MRLLLALPYYAPAYAFGGSVTVAETVAEGFVAAGHEVTVVTTDVLDERRRVERGTPPSPPQARVVRFPNVSHRAAAAANVYLPRGLRGWLRRELAGHDVVLLQDVYSAVSVSTARAAARAGVPYALQPLGTLSPATERGRSVAKHAFLALWGRRTLRGAAALICSSEHERGDFVAAGADPARIVELPLPLDLPAAQGIPRAERPTVVYVGRLHEIKGVDRLIRAVAIAARDVPGLHLEVAGPGTQHQHGLEALARQVGAPVTFHGFVSQPEKLRLFERAHLFALLSRSEGLPMAALEAFACGTPGVLSRGCHMPEVDGRAGLVVPGEPDDAAAAIVSLLADAPRRERLAAGARELAHGYRREVVMPRMVAALEALSAGAPPP